MDAVGVVLIGVGGFLLYAAYKNEHPWTMFTQTLSTGTLPAPGASTAVGVAEGAQILKQAQTTGH